MTDHVVLVSVGAQDDTKEISKVLKFNRNRRLIKVKLENGSKLSLTFSEEVTDPRIHWLNMPIIHKRVLQVSKRKYTDVYERIRYVLKNEEKTQTQTLKRHKEWQVLSPIIELKDKWLVFMI